MVEACKNESGQMAVNTTSLNVDLAKAREQLYPA